MNITDSTIKANVADGGAAGSGSGEGGGIYNLGMYTLDSKTVVNGNEASTAFNDIFG